jgi:hypothetical protein
MPPRRKTQSFGDRRLSASNDPLVENARKSAPTTFAVPGRDRFEATAPCEIDNTTPQSARSVPTADNTAQTSSNAVPKRAGTDDLRTCIGCDSGRSLNWRLISAAVPTLHSGSLDAFSTERAGLGHDASGGYTDASPSDYPTSTLWDA